SIFALDPPVSELENAVPDVLVTLLLPPLTAIKPPPLTEKAVAEVVLMLRPPLLKLILVATVFVEMVTAVLPEVFSTLLVPVKLTVLKPLFARLMPVPVALVCDNDPHNVTV